jgi:hypothetical protein
MVTPSEKEGYDELDRQKRSGKQSQSGGQSQVGETDGRNFKLPTLHFALGRRPFVRNKAKWQ